MSQTTQQPSGPSLEIIQKKSYIEKLGPKSQLVLVCKSSNTVTDIDIKDEKQASEKTHLRRQRRAAGGEIFFSNRF